MKTLPSFNLKRNDFKNNRFTIKDAALPENIPLAMCIFEEEVVLFTLAAYAINHWISNGKHPSFIFRKWVFSTENRWDCFSQDRNDSLGEKGESFESSSLFLSLSLSFLSPAHLSFSLFLSLSLPLFFSLGGKFLCSTIWDIVLMYAHVYWTSKLTQVYA